MAAVQRRQQLLEKLIRDGPLSAAEAAELAEHGWDSEVELVVLSRADAASLLARFVAGQLSAKELSEWSNSVEGRDDVGYEPGHESLLIDLIFQLANPEIHHELTTKVAEDWLERLRAG